MNIRSTKNSEDIPPPLFSLGNCSLTPGISNLLKQHALPIYGYLCRHQRGDWGDISTEEAAKNDLFLQQGLPLLSSYDFKSKDDADLTINIWVITVLYDSVATRRILKAYPMSQNTMQLHTTHADYRNLPMQQRTDIDLPTRTSLARYWPNLAAEIQDALIDAVHHPRVLDGSRRPCLLVETTAELLPPNADDRDMWSLHHWLVSQSIAHTFQRCRLTMTAHRIHICLTVSDSLSMSRINEPLRITQRHHSQPNRSTTMPIINPNQPQRQHSQQNRSNPMNINSGLSASPDHASRMPKKKSWFNGFIDWLFGPAEAIEKHRDDPLIDPPSTSGEMAPTDSWLEAFNQALTQATADFIRRQVEPLHREDPSCGFSIRAVKVGMTEITRPCLEAVEKLPPDLCSRIAKIRMQQAHGAQQIRLDNFFGISIDADSALLDGPVVQTLVSYGGKRVQLKFRFDGDYVTLPVINMNSPIDRNTPAVSDDYPVLAPSIKKQTILKSPKEPICAGIKKGTVLRDNIELPTQPIIAKLHIKPWDSDEIVVEINDNELPYTIGREPDGHGFIVESDNEESVDIVSRRHLILESFDSLTGHFCVYNRGAMANGTYHKGREMPERFIHVCHNDHWLSLGGVDGAGTVQIALELLK